MVSTGMANPIPIFPGVPPGEKIEVLIPIRRPWLSRRGPPLFPAIYKQFVNIIESVSKMQATLKKKKTTVVKVDLPGLIAASVWMHP